jgi:hypothetical protein
VNQQNAADGKFDLGGTFLGERFFQPGERSAGAADAAVAGFGVLLERYSAGKTARKTPSVELVEKLAVVITLDAQAGSVLVRKRPANIVVAADIVDPGRLGVNFETG